MKGLQSVFCCFFAKSFNKVNKTGIGMVNSIPYDSKVTPKVPCMNSLRFFDFLMQSCNGCHNALLNI